MTLCSLFVHALSTHHAQFLPDPVRAVAEARGRWSRASAVVKKPAISYQPQASLMGRPQRVSRQSTSQPKANGDRMPARDLDAVIVGAGFAGLHMLHRLRGLGFKARVLEAGSGVGGTWYWNRYPGARCDVESVQYSYQFDEALQQEWEWTERYAAQPELLRYANHVADRFDLRRDIECNTRVASAAFDEAAGRWVIEANGAARGRVLPHGKLAARGGELRGQGGSCDRHRLLGRAVDPDHRRPSQ